MFVSETMKQFKIQAGKIEMYKIVIFPKPTEK